MPILNGSKWCWGSSKKHITLNGHDYWLKNQRSQRLKSIMAKRSKKSTSYRAKFMVIIMMGVSRLIPKMLLKPQWRFQCIQCLSLEQRSVIQLTEADLMPQRLCNSQTLNPRIHCKTIIIAQNADENKRETYWGRLSGRPPFSYWANKFKEGAGTYFGNPYRHYRWYSNVLFLC